MALYSLNLEVRSRKRGSERARVPAPALIHRNCVLRLSSLLRLQLSPSACGRGGGAPAPCLAPVACQFVAGGPRGEDSASGVESVARVFTRSHLSLAAFAVSVEGANTPFGRAREPLPHGVLGRRSQTH